MQTFNTLVGSAGLILTVIFAIIAVLTPIWIYFIYLNTGRSRDELRKIRLLLEKQPNQQEPEQTPAEMKTCPYCTEEVRQTATTCRYCGADFSLPEAEMLPINYGEPVETDNSKSNKNKNDW